MSAARQLELPLALPDGASAGKEKAGAAARPGAKPAMASASGGPRAGDAVKRS